MNEDNIFCLFTKNGSVLTKEGTALILKIVMEMIKVRALRRILNAEKDVIVIWTKYEQTALGTGFGFKFYMTVVVGVEDLYVEFIVNPEHASNVITRETISRADLQSLRRLNN